MTLAARGRAIAVSGFLLSGAVGIISSTQTWLTVERADAAEAILVPGAAALPLLAPLSLAVLALGIALSIVGPVVRLVFGVLSTAAALFLGWTTLQLLLSEPLDAVGGTVTETTGLAGSTAIADLVAGIELSSWPVVTLIGWVVAIAMHVAFFVFTCVSWPSGEKGARTMRSEKPLLPTEAMS
jgi:hypothetical protein